jgi:hypothetical protein
MTLQELMYKYFYTSGGSELGVFKRCCALADYNVATGVSHP